MQTVVQLSPEIHTSKETPLTEVSLTQREIMSPSSRADELITNTGETHSPLVRLMPLCSHDFKGYAVVVSQVICRSPILLHQADVHLGTVNEEEGMHVTWPEAASSVLAQ